MGNYADWGDVVGRYPKAATKVDSEEMQESYTAGVEAIVNGFLADRYTVPVADKPPLLTDITVDLVYAKIAVNQDKGIPAIKKAAMDLLMKIHDGTIPLINASDEEVASEPGVSWSTEQDYESTHSHLGPDWDRVDPDRLEDLANDRS